VSDQPQNHGPRPLVESQACEPTFARPVTMLFCAATPACPDSGGWSPDWLFQHRSAVVVPAVHGVFSGTSKNWVMGYPLLKAPQDEPCSKRIIGSNDREINTQVTSSPVAPGGIDGYLPPPRAMSTA
jgi:hypothetical protein